MHGSMDSTARRIVALRFGKHETVQKMRWLKEWSDGGLQMVQHDAPGSATNETSCIRAKMLDGIGPEGIVVQESRQESRNFMLDPFAMLCRCFVRMVHDGMVNNTISTRLGSMMR